MGDLLFSAEAAIGLALQGVLVLFLLRGPFQKYFFVFLYSLVYLLTSAIEAFVIWRVGKSTPVYARIYWTNEIILDVLLFLLVGLLTYRATEGSPIRGAVGKLLLVVVVVAAVLPFVIAPKPYFAVRWFRMTSQIVNFGGAVMNLGLWTALIGSRRKDPQLLTVSAGLGIAVTGQAIYYGLRLMTTNVLVRNASDVINVVSYIAGVAIWCWAFRPRVGTGSGPAGVLPSNA